MKKIIAILAAASMLAATLVLSSCGTETEVDTTPETDVETEVETETETETETEVEAETETETETETEVETETETETEATEEDNTLVMATNAYFRPYEYYEGDKIVGIDAEIAEAIAEKLGMTLVIEDMEFNSIITAVQSGSVDMGVAGMTVTEDRLESVNFSSSYANGVQSIIVPEGSEIKTVDDLYAEGASYKVGVQLATTGDTYSTGDFGDENVTRYSNGNEAVLGLKGGDVDCVIIDNEPAKALVAENEGLVILDTAYADEDYAICVAKENTELLDKVNVAIDELTADGTIDAIIAKYIK